MVYGTRGYHSPSEIKRRETRFTKAPSHHLVHCQQRLHDECGKSSSVSITSNQRQWIGIVVLIYRYNNDEEKNEKTRTIKPQTLDYFWQVWRSARTLGLLLFEKAMPVQQFTQYIEITLVVYEYAFADK